MNGVVERLAFRGPEVRYHAFDAATHVGRYLAARPFCAGKRVLDIACGEGYGSFLLAQWGAESVFGIDISEAAINSASAVFAHERVQFVAGDETALDELVKGNGPFDVILSLETIEHVPDPGAMLRRLRNQLAPGGILVVSCPNEPDVGFAETENPYHLSHWTFADFRDFTESILGAASQWLLETPVIGATLYDASGPATHASGGDPLDILRGSQPYQALVMPAQHNVAPGPDDCVAYLGIWGATLGEAVACAAISRSGFLQPWYEAASRDAAIASLSENVAALTETAAILKETNATLAETNARLFREQQEDRQQLLYYSTLLRAERAGAVDAVGIEASRVFQLTSSRRIARLYIRMFTLPVAGRTLRAARQAAGRMLRREER